MPRKGQLTPPLPAESISCASSMARGSSDSAYARLSRTGMFCATAASPAVCSSSYSPKPPPPQPPPEPPPAAGPPTDCRRTSASHSRAPTSRPSLRRRSAYGSLRTSSPASMAASYTCIASRSDPPTLSVTFSATSSVARGSRTPFTSTQPWWGSSLNASPRDLPKSAPKMRTGGESEAAGITTQSVGVAKRLLGSDGGRSTALTSARGSICIGSCSPHSASSA
mmetsp:Transcript_9471/g.31501  ORF Transcript_9471/g.31501 Transcript_9471/m.31501 type:complete len:224 (-) Transcript_9471:58-729(-)